MNQQQLKNLLEQVKSGDVAIDDAIGKLKHMPFEDLGFAMVDHHRALRNGMPEVIFGQGKTPEHILQISQRLLERSPNLLATRVAPEAAEVVVRSLEGAEYHPLSKVLRVWRDKTDQGKGKIAVVCAGTADLPVAEEARLTAEVMGNDIDAITDVGVAGIHRLLANVERLRTARVVIAVAGMEASLATAIGGYGSHYNGLASLLSMLNSCASNVSVVNIDNGFGGGYVASLINRLP